MKCRMPLVATLLAAAIPMAAIAQGATPDAKRPAPPQAPAPAKAPTAPSAPTATAGAQEQPKKKAPVKKDTKKADAKKADTKKAASKTAKDASGKSTVQAPATVSTGPKELRDKDGNVIPTDPSAYPIDSARPRK